MCGVCVCVCVCVGVYMMTGDEIKLQLNPLNTKPKGPLRNFMLSVFHVISTARLSLAQTGLMLISDIVIE